MADDWTEILAFTDASGKRLTIGHAIGYVRIAVRSPASLVLNEIVLDAGHRELFAKAYAEAERQAEAHDA